MTVLRLAHRRIDSLSGRRSVAQLARKCWGSFSSTSLVTWAAQVAGGDEPPSVLSDNLPKVWLAKVWLIARPFVVSRPFVVF